MQMAGGATADTGTLWVRNVNGIAFHVHGAGSSDKTLLDGEVMVGYHPDLGQTSQFKTRKMKIGGPWPKDIIAVSQAIVRTSPELDAAVEYVTKYARSEYPDV